MASVIFARGSAGASSHRTECLGALAYATQVRIYKTVLLPTVTQQEKS